MSVTLDILSPGELALDAGGARLVQGPPGEAATVEIGAVTNGDAASVTNIGSATHAVLDFVLPKGDTGEQGPRGETGETGPRGATFTPALDAEGVLSWTNDGGFANPAPVSVRGPRGPQGEKGETGEAGPQGPQGEKGDTGDAGPQGPAGADGGYYQPGISAEGLLTWTPSRGGMPAVSAASVIGPRGEKGETGAQGPAGAPGAAATVAVGTVTTGAAGSTASVVNAGTASAAVLNFVIPRGDKGETGAQGPAGADGADGAQGPAGAAGKSAYQYALEAGYTGTEAELSAALAGLGDINGVLDAINGEVV